MSEKPLVTVLLTSYNHDNYIAEAINSVLRQKCSFSYELLITDDCSTDDSPNIIEQFQLKYPKLIKIIANKQNIGLNATYRNALESAHGDFIAPLSGDDYWIDENKLEMQIQFLLPNKEITYVHTEYKALYEADGKILRHRNKGWRSILTKKNGKDALIAMLCHNWTGYPSSITSCFLKAPLLEGITNHPEILNCDLSGEGTIVHASMSYYGGLYAFIPVETAVYRIRKKSLSHYESKIEQFNYQKRYFLLRLLTAESFCLAQNEIKKIQKRGLFELFKLALSLDTINKFQRFVKIKSKDNKIKFCYNFFLHLSRLRIFRYIFIIIFRFANKIQNKYRKIFG